MGYPGGKAGAGIYQTIINQMPPHRRYVEGCLGGGAIMRYKRPAEVSVAFELDLEAVEGFDCEVPGLQIYQEDVLKALWAKSHGLDEVDTLLYLDPPYVMSTRKAGPMYKFEWNDQQHLSMLDAVGQLPCLVAISGYWSQMYAEALKDWRAISFWSVTRSGKLAEEWLWMNYPEPTELHDYRYHGTRRGPRQAFKRKGQRWSKRLRELGPVEAEALKLALAGAQGEIFESPERIKLERAALRAAVAGDE